MSYQPPQQSSFPPPPRSSQPLWRRGLSWYRVRSRRMQILVGVGVVLLLLICIAGIGAATGGNQQGSTSTATPGIVQATATNAPTSAPRPTATNAATASSTPAGPRLLTGATLGGLISAFQSLYGSPDCCGGTAQRYKFAADGANGEVLAVPSGDTSGDGQFHVESITIFPQNGSWSSATAAMLYLLFLPPDAKRQQDKQVSGYGTEHVYLSADLAAIFPASDFTDVGTNQPVPPGTFSVGCGQGFRSDGGCGLILGV